jgi:hypothetical protein
MHSAARDEALQRSALVQLRGALIRGVGSDAQGDDSASTEFLDQSDDLVAQLLAELRAEARLCPRVTCDASTQTLGWPAPTAAPPAPVRIVFPPAAAAAEPAARPAAAPFPAERAAIKPAARAAEVPFPAEWAATLPPFVAILIAAPPARLTAPAPPLPPPLPAPSLLAHDLLMGGDSLLSPAVEEHCASTWVQYGRVWSGRRLSTCGT